MLRIISLLNQKNHYLEKFYSMNEAELLNFAQNDFNHLDEFYDTREKILENIKYIDTQIHLENPDIAKLTIENKKEISVALAIKDEYVNRILAQDLEILSCIENAKSNIIRELADLKKTRKAVGSYKTKTFNQRLDEEA